VARFSRPKALGGKAGQFKKQKKGGGKKRSVPLGGRSTAESRREDLELSGGKEFDSRLTETSDGQKIFRRSPGEDVGHLLRGLKEQRVHWGKRKGGTLFS